MKDLENLLYNPLTLRAIEILAQTEYATNSEDPDAIPKAWVNAVLEVMAANDYFAVRKPVLKWPTND